MNQRLLNRSILLLVFDPLWIDRRHSIVNAPTLAACRQSGRSFLGDILKASGGLVRYQIAERVDVPAFPPLRDGFRYSAKDYMAVLHGTAQPHHPEEADYAAILREHRLLARVASGQVDEVWMFGFPHAGFHESTMAGPGAFWCNAPPRQSTGASRRRFVIMGFSYERTVGEMLESYCHRVESIMMRVFRGQPTGQDLWERFTRHEQRSPGGAACGTVHFAPNSAREYDWGNQTSVRSECDDWLHNFPAFKGDVREVNTTEWGNGDTRLHHMWWLSHLPRVAGRMNGIHNNWWQYIADPSRVPA
jgi:hypothetical protein